MAVVDDDDDTDDTFDDTLIQVIEKVSLFYSNTKRKTNDDYSKQC